MGKITEEGAEELARYGGTLKSTDTEIAVTTAKGDVLVLEKEAAFKGVLIGVGEPKGFETTKSWACF